MIERHDRIKFEVFALSFGADDNTVIRARVEVAFERFIDVRLKSDREVAARILTAANVPELITHSLREHDDRAAELAKDSTLLSAIQVLAIEAKLKREQSQSVPLFVADRMIRPIERADETMWRHHQRSEACGDIFLRPNSSLDFI
jgi:predicted O-linked N-acetylglucosamine transferase (SPINDLY family)